MHEETVSTACLQLIKDLGSSLAPKFYLVGGTALSLHLGHRISIDLDIFTHQDFEISDIPKLSDFGATTVRRSHKNNLLSYVNGVKVEFMLFAYKPLHKFYNWHGLQIVDARDIGLFKLLTLLGRNNRKDIVDLFMIDREVIDLGDLFNDFMEHYPSGDVEMFKNLQILFDDEAIMRSVMPRMLIDIEFLEAYNHVKSKLTRIIKREL